MERFKSFIDLFRETYFELESQPIPLNGILLLEERIPILFRMTQEYKTEYDEINQFDFDERVKIVKELEGILKQDFMLPIDLKKKFKESKYRMDEEMYKIILYFYDLPDFIYDEIDTTEVYVSSNNDFMLTIAEMSRLKKGMNGQDSKHNFNEFLTLFIPDPNIRNQLFKSLKGHFSECNHGILRMAINGRDFGAGRLIFHGEGVKFLGYLKPLYNGKDILSSRSMLVKWVLENFKYLKNDSPSFFTKATVEKYLSESLPEDELVK